MNGNQLPYRSNAATIQCGERPIVRMRLRENHLRSRLENARAGAVKEAILILECLARHCRAGLYAAPYMATAGYGGLQSPSA